MSHRWGPGSSDWIRVVDYGDSAVWVRPETDGATICVYAGDGFGHLADTDGAEVWTVRVLRGSDLLDTVMDKIHRIRWVRDGGSWDASGIVPALCCDFKVVSWERIDVPRSHHGHPRLNFNRHIWRWPLPRQVHDALGYGERSRA